MSRCTLICEASGKRRHVLRDPQTNKETETYVAKAEFQAAPNSPENQKFWLAQAGAFLRLQGCAQRFKFNARYNLDFYPVEGAPPPAEGATRLRFTCQLGDQRRLVQQRPNAAPIDAPVWDVELFPTASAEENKTFFTAGAGSFLKLVACTPEFEAEDEYFVDISEAAPAEATPAAII